MENTSLTLVKRFYFKRKRLPTYREMQELFGFASVNAVTYAINKWIEEGIFKKDEGKLIPSSQFFGLPLLGHIHAGSPSVEDTYLIDYLSLEDLYYINPVGKYALHVKGDSMQDAGILDGDLVILDKKREVKIGDVIAAYVDGEWTLKYYRKFAGKIALVPANKKYKTIFAKKSLELGGIVIKVIRDYK